MISLLLQQAIELATEPRLENKQKSQKLELKISGPSTEGHYSHEQKQYIAIQITLAIERLEKGWEINDRRTLRNMDSYDPGASHFLHSIYQFPR